MACSSESLELRSYKPDFPASIPHLTLYDGSPSKEAATALRLLSGFPWSLTFGTVLDVHASSHDALLQSSATDRRGILLTDAAEELRRQVFDSLGLTKVHLSDLRSSDKLAVIEAIAKLIHEDPLVSTARSPRAEAITLLSSQTAGQLAFWTPEEVWALSGEGPRHRRSELRRRSAFATPPELALDVAKAVAKYASLPPAEMVDFGDPAVGNGVLYAAAREAVGADRLNSARVVEIDPLTARSTNQRWARTGISVLEGDFLGVPPEAGAWSLVLANPPYRRSQDISQDLSHLRAAFLSRLGVTVSARADLYLYFLLQADSWLRHGGIAGWIIPSEFQVTSYGAALRNYLSKNVELLRMHTYAAEDPLFDNALASTTVVIFRKLSPGRNSSTTVTRGGTIAAPNDSVKVTAETLRSSRRWSYAALVSTRKHQLSDEDIRLGDIFTLRRGIATGANSYFVLNDEQVESLHVQQEWIRPLVPRARDVEQGCIRADSGGNPVPRSGRWLIDTSASLEEIEEISPAFAEYLQRLVAAVGDRHLVARRSSPFKQEAREAAPVLFLYMAKKAATTYRFIRNESRAIHLNNLIGLYPKPSLDLVFGSVGQAAASLQAINITDLEAAGRTYGNGLLKLEPKELADLRLTRSRSV